MNEGEDPAARLAQIRAWRSRPERDLSIAALVAERARQAKRARSRLGSFVELWEGLVPPELAAHTKVASLRSGVVHVVADSSPTAYELDRLLREGLEQTLRRAFGRTLLKVRVTVGRVA